MNDDREAQLDQMQEWLDHHPLNFDRVCIRCELNGAEPCEKHKPTPIPPLSVGMQVLHSEFRKLSAEEWVAAHLRSIADRYGSPAAAYQQWIGRTSVSDE